MDVVLICLTICLVVFIHISKKIIYLPETIQMKYPSIEGVRGILAFAVFIHHSYIWKSFLKTNNWQEPVIHLYNNLGQLAVSIFFMITSFLFIRKLVEAEESIDWRVLFAGRIRRLVPVYFISIIVLIVILLIKCDFVINDKLTHIVRDVFKWFAFTIFGSPDVNNFKNTYLIIAGVTWTLKYEWLFYLSLPILNIILFRKRVDLFGILVIIFFIYTVIEVKPEFKLYFPFFIGISVAFLYEKIIQIKLLKTSLFAVGFVLLLLVVLFSFSNSRELFSQILSGILFVILVSGNSIFSILRNNYLLELSRTTYSFYLIHGIVLYVVFNFFIGIDTLKMMSFYAYWGIVVLALFITVLLSRILFKFMEFKMLNKK